MNKAFHDHATQANYRLIAQVAEYYNNANKSLEFYKEVNNIPLQEISTEHIMNWKQELHNLIFNGMNCTDERSA